MYHVRLRFLLKGQLVFEAFFKHIICFFFYFKVERTVTIGLVRATCELSNYQ